jgi:hypothetical protein
MPIKLFYLKLLRKISLQAALFFFSPLLLFSCATYQSKIEPARQSLSSGQLSESIEKFQALAETESKDQLAYLLDYATALHITKDFKKSNSTFLKADELAEQLDYHSISKVTASLLLNEEQKQYKGDTFEKIFINAFLALNFLEMNEYDSALVESRRINEKLKKYRAEDKKEFELNAFALYLSALAWESQKQYDDASIAYTHFYELSPDSSQIKKDLLMITQKARRFDEYKKWKEKFAVLDSKSPSAASLTESRNLGELIIIYQQGWGPQKVFNNFDYRFPELRSKYSVTTSAQVKLGDTNYESEIIYDTDQAARKTLEDDRLSLVGRRMLGIGAKYVAADEIRRKDETLGLLAWLFMRFSDRADLRQWSTLPKTIQIIRIPLPAGEQTIRIQGYDAYRQPTNEFKLFESVKIGAGKKTFLNWRSLN